MLILSFTGLGGGGGGIFESIYTCVHSNDSIPVLKAVKNIEVYAKLRNKLNGFIIFLSLIKRVNL